MDDPFSILQTFKVSFVIDEFNEHFHFLLYWLDIQYIYCLFVQAASDRSENYGVSLAG
nr:MAG TPA_asm: hypothetical protein [Bacteriophage sp.]